MTGAANFRFLALLSSIPVALLTLQKMMQKQGECQTLYHQALFHLQSLLPFSFFSFSLKSLSRLFQLDI